MVPAAHLFPLNTLESQSLFILGPLLRGGSAMSPPTIAGLASRGDDNLSSDSGQGLRIEEALPGSVAGLLTSLVATSFVFLFLGGSD